jgi:hypothetical protein
MAPFREMFGASLRLSARDLLVHQSLLVAAVARPTHPPRPGVVVARQARRSQSDATAEEPQSQASGPEAVVDLTQARPHIHADPAIRERPAGNRSAGVPPRAISHAAAAYPVAIRVATPFVLKTHCRVLVERPHRRFRKRLPDAAVLARSTHSPHSPHCGAVAADQTQVSSHALAATGRMQASNCRTAVAEPTM